MTGSTQDAHTRSPQVDTPYLDKTDPWSSHGKILAWLQRAPGGSVVLDIGVATGTMARYSAGRGLVFTGVEPVASWAEAARDFYQEIRVCPIEAAPDEFIRGADVVILGDVVEHLVSPEATLRRIVSLQDAECRFYISTPNVANVWVRLSLLFGRFDYTDRGILDRTHLHFFTRKTFLAFLDCCGLQPNRLEVTPIPLNLVNPFFQQNGIGRLFHRLLAQLTGLFPTLLGYQFVTDAHQKNTALSSSMEIEK